MPEKRPTPAANNVKERRSSLSAKGASKEVDRVQVEAELVKKYNIAKVEGRSVVDTNRGNGRRSSQTWEAGVLETEFIQKVKDKDREWVNKTLQQYGRDLILSPYGGGIAQTCILYAAGNGDVDMIKCLTKWGGRDLINVRDFKGRDAIHYAKKNGHDLLKVLEEQKGVVTVDCWNKDYSEKKKSQQSGSDSSGSHKGALKDDNGRDSNGIPIGSRDSNGIPLGSRDSNGGRISEMSSHFGGGRISGASVDDLLVFEDGVLNDVNENSESVDDITVEEGKKDVHTAIDKSGNKKSANDAHDVPLIRA